MKLKQIESLLKARKKIVIYEVFECQWFSDEVAFYPVYGLPKLSKNNIFTMFDIPTDKQDKFLFSYAVLPTDLNFSDSDDSEKSFNAQFYWYFGRGQNVRAFSNEPRYGLYKHQIPKTVF